MVIFDQQNIYTNAEKNARIAVKNGKDHGVFSVCTSNLSSLRGYSARHCASFTVLCTEYVWSYIDYT